MMGNDWIPVIKKPPKVDPTRGRSKCVLVTCEWRDTDMFGTERWVSKLYYDGEKWFLPTGDEYSNAVVAWMPMPKPYEGDGGH